MFGYVKYFPYLCTKLLTTKLKKKMGDQKIKIVEDFVWLLITDKAKEVYQSGLFDGSICALHDDGSESLCDTYEDLTEALERGLEIGIEVGHITKPKPKEVELVVWYTEEIPVSVGPDNYAGLPGAILEVNTDNGSNVIMATEVSTKFPKKELVQPTKGDKMNRAQFQDAMKKIMEDMQRGGGMGGIRIGRGGN